MSPRKLRFDPRFPGRYDTDPDAITRPDMVAPALRFGRAEDSNSSIVDHRMNRELSKYPSLPDTPASRDEPTVVDAALQRSMETSRPSEQHSVEPPRSSETRLARPVSDVPRSGTRHRLESTVPPPKRARRSSVQGPKLVEHREPQPTPVHEPELEPRRQKAWPLVVAASLTTAFAMMLGTSLGDGSLKRATENLFASHPKPVHAMPLPVTPVATSRPVSKAPEAPPPIVAPVPEESSVPAMRFEDLPVSKESAADAKAKRSSKASRRRTTVQRQP